MSDRSEPTPMRVPEAIGMTEEAPAVRAEEASAVRAEEAPAVGTRA